MLHVLIIKVLLHPPNRDSSLKVRKTKQLYILLDGLY